MQKYIRFDAEQFLKDSKTWEGEIKKLTEELEAISEIGELSSSAVKSSAVSKPVERAILERDEVLSKISRIDEFKEAFAYAWDHLDGPDAELLQGFFFNDTPIWKFVDAWAEKNNTNTRYCYFARRKAVEQFRMLIESWLITHGYRW